MTAKRNTAIVGGGNISGSKFRRLTVIRQQNCTNDISVYHSLEVIQEEIINDSYHIMQDNHDNRIDGL